MATKEVSFVGPQTAVQRRAFRRIALGVALVTGLVALSGCSAEGKDELQRLAMPAPRTVQAQEIYTLWHWTWLTAIIIGVIVWGLIFYAVIKFRRRSDDEIPVQTRYNLPIEIFYTVAPVMIVIVFFFFTLKAQNAVLPSDAKAPKPDQTIQVVGQRWSWAFNYTNKDNGQQVFDVGSTNDAPTLYLPVDQNIRFNLYSPDVIHSFWVPSFLFKMDVVPGRKNHFTLEPNRKGTYVGKCAELCGTYHSRMLFNVKVVSEADYQQHLLDLAARGNVGKALGPNYDNVQPGLESGEGGSE